MYSFAVKALQAIKSRLIDPNRNLSNWDRGDSCTSKWTGIVCYNTTLDDGYLHVDQLYDFNLCYFISIREQYWFGKCCIFFHLEHFSVFLLSPLHDEIFRIPLLSLVILVDEGNEIPWFFSSFKIQKNYWDVIQ